MKEFHSLLKRQFDAGLIRGCLVLVGTPEKELFFHAEGRADLKKGKPLSRDALFDMASVTKAVGIGTLLAMLHQEGKLDYQAPFTEYLPSFRTPLENVPSVLQLATHCSGISPDRSYDRAVTGGSARLLDAMNDLRFSDPPGNCYRYFCANYILLGMIVENLAGMPLEVLSQKRIFGPLGMSSSSWGIPLPACREKLVHAGLVGTHGEAPESAVPPEIWQLHQADMLPSDETARWALPRRIGNAGLFSTADDLAAFARWMLARPFPEDTWKWLAENRAPAGLHRRSAGWDMESAPPFSARTIFHTGWSGQTLWIAPEQRLFAMVLTNRREWYAEEQAGCPGIRFEKYAEAKEGRFLLMKALLPELGFGK
ncbi:MAG: beta-lactamase family protein [Lentisphaeria bacterium]|nr:beta-lactamase family protein [Lentisphaeria bacterium]